MAPSRVNETVTRWRGSDSRTSRSPAVAQSPPRTRTTHPSANIATRANGHCRSVRSVTGSSRASHWRWPEPLTTKSEPSAATAEAIRVSNVACLSTRPVVGSTRPSSNREDVGDSCQSR